MVTGVCGWQVALKQLSLKGLEDGYTVSLMPGVDACKGSHTLQHPPPFSTDCAFILAPGQLLEASKLATEKRE